MNELRDELERSHGGIAYNTVAGETAWSPERSAIIERFSDRIGKVFEPIGGMNPGTTATFWSGPSVKGAAQTGLDFAKTLPGRVINKVEGPLIKAFAENAFKGNKLDTGLIIGLWEAMSIQYAQGSKGDVHLYLLDGITSVNSVFWNRELPKLREGQQNGLIGEIYIHTLQPQKLVLYDERKARVREEKAKDADESTLKKLEKQAQDVLIRPEAWTTGEKFEVSKAFALKTSGTDPSKLSTVRNKKLLEVRDKFLSLLRSRSLTTDSTSVTPT